MRAILAMFALLLVALAPAGPRTLPYGADPAQRVDVTPAAKPRAPLVVYIHGGGWAHGSRAMVDAKPGFFTGHGYAFASVGYRLVPATDVAGQAQDVADAIAALRRQAPALGIDPDRIALIGHSAGAHLAALVATDTRYLDKAGVPVKAIRAVELLDGAGYDVPRQMAVAGPMLRGLYAAAFGDDVAIQRALSPTLHAAAPNAGAFEMHAVAARPDSPAQADALAAAIVRAGGTATVIRVPDRDHVTLNRRFGDTGDHVSAEVLAFFARYL